ncbi:hypothetical protein EUX98_g6561 [Antrodiella citrinella]|uniref:DAGKc domain-containing protein n=1 Tax=Antrodiella citrinella TaxID=2447956 RepID=A0A4S4MNT7_9APHY|nr:hypothetical protein EUX98_g6561 [Antrodiella citrinella]
MSFEESQALRKLQRLSSTKGVQYCSVRPYLLFPTLMANLLVLYNPVCGAGNAKKAFDERVIPLLKQHGKVPDSIVETTHVGHAGEVVIEYLHTKPGPLTIVLGSGDGTLHEIVVALYNATFDVAIEISVVLVPSGTANALYWSLFPPQETSQAKSESPSRALDAFLSQSPVFPRPLTFAVTTFPSATGTVTSVAVVVTSAALHASILHDSEALRSTHPGIERFKIAAQQNITRWYDATVKLHPSPGSQSVEIYNPKAKRFEAWETEGEVELVGPFAYFLSTVNVDRLESAFRITPLHSPGSSGTTLDVVIIRPRRDKTIVDAEDVSRQAFAQKTTEVLMAAYQDGAHVGVTYGEEGESVLEYFRCGGWEWLPTSGDAHAHLVCVDGEIIHVAPNSTAECTATRKISNVQLSVVA